MKTRLKYYKFLHIFQENISYFLPMEASDPLLQKKELYGILRFTMIKGANFMKNIGITALCLASVLHLSACGSSDPAPQPYSVIPPAETTQPSLSIETPPVVAAPTPSYPQEELISLAQTLVNYMLEGNFYFPVDYFSPEVAEQLDVNDLQSVWQRTVATLGEHIGHFSTEGVVQSDGFLVTVTESYPETHLKVAILFQANSEISGISFSHAMPEAPAPEVLPENLEEIPPTEEILPENLEEIPPTEEILPENLEEPPPSEEIPPENTEEVPAENTEEPTT